MVRSIVRQPVRWRSPSPRRLVAVTCVAVVALVIAVLVTRDRPAQPVRATRSDALAAAGSGGTALPTIPPTGDPGGGSPATTVPGSMPGSVPTTVPGSPATTVPGSVPAATTNPDAALADPNLWVELHPELATAPAPSWVAAGTRLSYYAIAASVPGSYHQYVEDEDGGWIDPTTGDRYRQEDIPSPAGHGYHQVTVTSLDEHLAVLSIRVFGLTGVELTSPVTTLTWGGAVGFPAAGADYWVDPALLATLDEVVTDELKVLRMPYSIGDAVYDSIWVQLLGDDGNEVWVYDTVSGVLLHTATSTTGPPLTGPVAEGEGREGSTFLTQSTFVGVRQTTLPWIGASAPDWVGTIEHIDYAGSITVDVLGSPSVVLDASLAVDRVQSGSDWMRIAITRTLTSDVAPDITESLVRIDGPAQVGGLFLPPDALAALRAGQMVDQDPVTGATVTVEAVDAVGDETYVTIVEQGPAEASTMVYAVSTGLLVSSTATNATIGTTSRFDLVGWR